MGRRRWNKKHPDKARAQQQPRRPEDAADAPVRLLVLQPNSTVVGFAMGTRAVFVDYKTGGQIQLAGPNQPSAADVAAAVAAPGGPHTGTLRVLQFSPDGRFLLTGADDKVVKLWTCAPTAPGGAWHSVAAWRTPKKASAGGFTLNGSHALFADKFGDVLVGCVPAVGSGGAEEASISEPSPQVPSTLLGHFCTIVTGLASSPCGRFMATSDREYKVRISSLPEDPLQGSYEIQGYCLGHQDFVSCIAFAVQPDEHSGEGAAGKVRPSVLLSGSGDGTVRVWDFETCTQLSSYVASAPAAEPEAVARAAAEEEGDAAGAAGGGAGEGSSAPEELGGGEEASGG
ncbi:hypothetical protein Vretifemale_18584, partial [Volvox reticuliferus]